MKFLRSIKNLVEGSSSESALLHPPAKSGTVQTAPVYPPVDEGIPLSPLREVLETQAELLSRIRLSCGMKQEDYKQYIIPVIERYARYAHLLPATKIQHHRGAGGLLRLGLETAFYSMQAADGVIFAGLEATERKRDMEERWRYATFLAGLSMDLFRVPHSMVISSDVGGSHDPYENRLYDWATKAGVSRYFVKWSASEYKPPSNADLTANGPLLHLIVPPHAFAYLNAVGSKPMSAMLATITGTVSNSEILTINKIVTEMRNKIIERDKSLQPEMYGKLTVGVHIEPHIIDAMRRLVSRERWKVNAASGRIWYGDDGMFLLWRRDVAEEIVATVAENKVMGFPSEPDSILELMLKSGIVLSSGNGGCFELDSAAAQKDAKSKWRTVMRIANPDILQGEGCHIDKVAVSFLSTAKPKTSPTKPFQPTDVAIPDAAPDAAAANLSDQPAPGNSGDSSPVTPEGEPPSLEECAPPVEAEGLSQSNSEIARQGTEDSAADRLLTVVPTSVADVIKAMAEDYRADRADIRGFAWAKPGFAISYAKLVTYGMNPMDIVKHLDRASWLVLDGKKMVHNIVIDGSSEMSIVLMGAIAERLGFNRQKGGV